MPIERRAPRGLRLGQNISGWMSAESPVCLTSPTTPTMASQGTSSPPPACFIR